jgi:2-keto-4-pentenoate hydratase/2-oxohepta-3-ene-1,7-dioic acid hydratase in catechol pathway
MTQDVRFALGTFSVAGSAPFAGLVIDEKVIALRALNTYADVLGGRVYGADTVLGVLEDWERNLPLLRRGAQAYASGPLSAKLQALAVPAAQLRIHAPVENPRQILMARANYRSHVVDLLSAHGGGEGETLEERKASVGRMMDKLAAEGDPFAFIKLQSAVTGPFDDITVPTTTQKLDWELELAVVIGRRAFRVDRKDALDYVAGYCNANDLSARDILFRDDLGPGQDWTSSKCQPGFMPMGPYLVPADFVPNPHGLQVLLKRNGKVMQNEQTSDMLHDIPRMIEFFSRHVELLPGDIISTGSPNGNGMQVGVFIAPGDVIEASVTGLGTMRNTFVAEGV